MQNKSIQRLKESISKKPCRIKAFKGLKSAFQKSYAEIKAFKGLKDEIKEAMDLKEYKNEFFKVM